MENIWDFIISDKFTTINSFLSSRRRLCGFISIAFLILGFFFPDIADKILNVNIFTAIGILGLLILACSILGEKFGEHKVSELQGNWKPKGGVDDNGEILALDGSHSVKNVYVSASILAEKDSKTIDVKAATNWDIYKGDVFIRTISMNFEEWNIKIQKLSRNTWRYVSPDSENKITLSLKSASVAEVLEEERLTFNNVILPYKVNYSLYKQQ